MVCRLDAVEIPINVGRNRFDLGAELLLDLVHVEAILERDEVDREAKVAEPARATNAVEIGLRPIWGNRN